MPRWGTLNDENPQQVEDSRTCSGYFRGSNHDPWLTLKDENVGHVFNVTIFVAGVTLQA